MSGRWPPRGPGRAGETPPDPWDQMAALAKTVGDLSGAVRRMVPVVLASRLVQLDSSGQAAGTDRVPFQALAITSFSANTLTVAAAPPGAGAPGPGPGVSQIPPRGFRVINAAANAWSVYGGNPGDLICVEEFGQPLPPAASITSKVQLTSIAASTAIYGKATSPAALATIAALPQLPAGTYDVQWTVGLGGTTGAGDADNFQLVVPGWASSPFGSINSSTSGQFQPQPTVRVVLAAAGVISVQAIGIGTVGAVYRAQITATPAGGS